MKIPWVALVLLYLSLFICPESIFPWNNGPSGDAATDEDHPDCQNIPYSTHDWIADHARAFLPQGERKWLDDNLKLYLLGTEAPDNNKIPDTCKAPNNGYDDRRRSHSVKWNDDFSKLMHDQAAFRAKEEYLKVVRSINKGKLSYAAFYAGAMAHYIGDVSQYGHSVDFEVHHSDYERLIGSKTESFEVVFFKKYLTLDGLSEEDPYNAVVVISLATARGEGNIKSAFWMDSHYKKRNQQYWDSVGASLNKCVNLLADVLHTVYVKHKKLINNPHSAGEVEPVIYIVRSKDTLGSISKKFYGDGRRWRVILSSNRDKIADPKNLRVGTILAIP